MYGNPNNFKVPRNFVANNTITRTGKQFPVGLTSNLPSLAWSGCCIGAVDLSFRQHFAFCKNEKSSSDKTGHFHWKWQKRLFTVPFWPFRRRCHCCWIVHNTRLAVLEIVWIVKTHSLLSKVFHKARIVKSFHCSENPGLSLWCHNRCWLTNRNTASCGLKGYNFSAISRFSNRTEIKSKFHILIFSNQFLFF